MFIELTEALCCPREHPESYLVCVPALMDARRVVRGGLGCPVCHAEYAIVDGVVWFAPPAEGGPAGPPPSSLSADALRTFLDLQGRGGYVLLLGAVGATGPALAPLLPGVHVFAVNPPALVAPSATFSVLRSPHALPVRRSSMRGVVVGSDAAREPWLGAAAFTLLSGLRLVVEDEHAEPPGIVSLARGAGVFVGERRAR
jgi:uncharacterized protein YbaR (Trm112 family)